MRKLTILATTAAVAINAISPAFATQLPSWSEVISKAGTEGGGWVRGHHSNTVFKPLAGRDGFIFGNVLADDIPLPRVTDITKILRAAKQDAKPVVVASNNWILPSNPMLCAIAEQVKMTCADFTAMFYMYTQKDENGNYVGDTKAYETLADIQAEFIAQLDAMGVTASIDGGKSTQIIALENTIAMLEADAETNAATITALHATIQELKANHLLALNEKDLMLEMEKAARKKLEDDLQDKIDELAGVRKELQTANIKLEGLQSTINALVKARNGIGGDINDLQKLLKDAEAEITSLNKTISNMYTASEFIENYNAGYEAGKESVDITTDNQEAYDEGVASVDITTDNQEAYDEGVASVDITTDNQTAYNEGVASVDITKDNQEAYDEGVASVDITVDNQAAYDKGVASVDITTDNQAAYDEGVASVDITTDNQEAYDKGVASVDITTDNKAAFNEGFDAGVENTLNTVIDIAPVYEIDPSGIDAVHDVWDFAASVYEYGYAKGVASVLIDEKPHYVNYTDNSITFKVNASNGESTQFKVTAQDFKKDGFHLNFDEKNSDNFNFDVIASEYKEFVNSQFAAGAADGEHKILADIDAAFAGHEINVAFTEYDTIAAVVNDAVTKAKAQGHNQAVTQFVKDMNDHAETWSPDTAGTYTVQGDIENFAADVWNAAQAELKEDAEAYQTLVAQNAQNPAVVYVANLIVDAQAELSELENNIDEIMKESKKEAYNAGFADGYYWGHKDGKAGNTDNQNKNSETNPYN